MPAARPGVSIYCLRDAVGAEGLEFHATTAQRFLKGHGLAHEIRLALRRFERGHRRWTGH